MDTQMNRYLLLSGMGLLLAFTAMTARAVPNLQLDIIDGVYDTDTETIVTDANEFTLVAYGGGNSKKFEIGEDYFISIALTPQAGPDPVDFGSFDFAGTTYDIDDMVYGNPPIENTDPLQPHDGGDLGPHDIFPTFFTEVAFNFDENQTSDSVNTEDDTGTDPASNPGDDLFYMLFDADVTNLLGGYGLHFDLYNTKVKRGDDIDVNDFAPFSHDAAYTTTVPEPAPLVLLGLGMLILGTISVRRRRLLKRSSE